MKAVNLGLDTDTIGAIAGGRAGLYYGSEGIPMEWIFRVRALKFPGLSSQADQCSTIAPGLGDIYFGQLVCCST